MGACYSVNLKVNILDEDGIVNALNKHIIDDKRTNYSLDKYATQGITTETFDDLMRILLANNQGEVSIDKEGKFTIYDSCFNASYGWEGIMMDWFEIMAPFLADNSQMLIFPNTDYDKLVVKNGKYIQLH